MLEKLLVAIGLTFTLHLSMQTGLFSLSQTTLENIPNQTLWAVVEDN